MPQRSEFEQLRIAGEVDPFLSSNREYDITFDLDSSVTDASIVSSTRDLRGIPGTTAQVACIITPDAGKQLDASSFLATVGTGITLTGFEQMGTSVYGEFEVTFQDTDTTITVDIDGDAATDVPAGTDLSTVTLTLSESIGNVSLSRTSLTLTGIVGTTTIYDVTAYAADGFLLNPGNFSVTESESWLVMSNAVGGGESIGIPLEITFPQTDATGTATINGSAQAVGAETISISVNFTNDVSGSSLTDTSETFILNHGQKISYTNTLTPSRGSFMDASSLTITENSDANNLVSFSAHDAGGGSININTSITAPNSGTSSSATLTLSGSTSEEPYVATVNLTETLPYGKIINNTLAQRFGATDTNVVHNVTVLPIEGAASYPGTTTFTIVGGTASNYAYASGGVSFDLTIPLPTFNTAFPIGNVSMDCSITGIAPDSGTSIRDEADVNSLVGNSISVESTTVRYSGSTTIGGVAHSVATFNVITTPNPGLFTVSGGTKSGNTVTVTQPTTGGTRNGFPIFTTASKTATVTHSSSGESISVLAVQNISTYTNAAPPISSPVVDTIDVNIGGTAGTTTGVLYIT